MNGRLPWKGAQEKKIATKEQVATSISLLSQRVATLESSAAKDREQMVKLERAEKETEERVSELKLFLEILVFFH